ncbi:MAG: hypothetical protein Q8Q46_02850 [Candidatus Giovannonibacteria bacterium]|nr:hypothetical protein [Candidatus Giovannonibacteria bacterium]
MEIFKSSLILALLASLFFAGCAISLKLITGTGPHSDIIIWLGVAVIFIGCIWKFAEGGAFSGSLPLISYSILGGALWALGMICVIFAFEGRGGHISLVAPLYNINTIWVMIAGLVFFKEYEKVSVPYALTGSMLIVLGGGILGFAVRR